MIKAEVKRGVQTSFQKIRFSSLEGGQHLLASDSIRAQRCFVFVYTCVFVCVMYLR